MAEPNSRGKTKSGARGASLHFEVRAIPIEQGVTVPSGLQRDGDPLAFRADGGVSNAASGRRKIALRHDKASQSMRSTKDEASIKIMLNYQRL